MEQGDFSSAIKQLIEKRFSGKSESLLKNALLLQYIEIKTKSANSGSKARGSFGNLYAIYVLVEDYIAKGFVNKDEYSTYQGAIFSDLFSRQRELPFGEKLQNHALNNRLNEEFKKYFPQVESYPIVRDVENNKYWINENYLKIETEGEKYNIAELIIEIIDNYAVVKAKSFNEFIENLEKLKKITKSKDSAEAKLFIKSLLQPSVDARLFEIVSFAILKYFYLPQEVYFGFEIEKLEKENLMLYKTGRTNANDGGIDFVMKPLGRFFQVTETLDVRKYFLDIDKIQHYPITFVVKSDLSPKQIMEQIRGNAQKSYPVEKVVGRYMGCIEEVINLQILDNMLDTLIINERFEEMVDEIELQSKVEFNFSAN